MNYYKPLKTADGFTLSIDKAVIDYKLNGLASLDALVKFLDVLPIHMAVAIKHWSSFRWVSFRENYAIGFYDRNSFWLGVGLNNAKAEHTRVRLEFNPNKCAHHAAFLAVLTFLNGHTRPMQTAIKRYDLAVDIPVQRNNAKLIKDGRVYSERRHGKEWTEYGGRRYDRLSLSEKIRAGMEVSELVKRLTGRNYPVFVDNMESVDDLANVRPTGQIIMAKCVRGAPLEVRPIGAIPEAEAKAA